MLASASLTYANYNDLQNRNSEATKYYQQAKSYTDSVILSGKYQLVNNYADLWDVGKEEYNYSKEVIYGIQYTRDPNDNSFNSKGSDFARNYCPAGTAYSSRTIGSYAVQPWFYDEYNTGEYKGDYRTKVSFMTNWVNVNNGKLTVGYPESIPAGAINGKFPFVAKYKDPSGNENNNENDMYILRLSHIYLIKAEAENELNGPTPEAYNAFNQLRIRARKADGTPASVPADLSAGLTKDEFRMAVLKERGLEFVGEGCNRYFDLLRMKAPNGKVLYMYQVEDFLPTIPEGDPTWNSQSKTWKGGRKNNRPFEFFTSKNLLLPIPQAELNANPNFGDQNPGW